MFTLDANIFARDIDPSEAKHETCHALIEQLRLQNISIIVPLLILPEIAAAVSRTRRDPVRARVFVDIVRSLPNIMLMPLDQALADEAAELAADRALRGADAVYVAIARRYNCVLVSLDREQRERAALVITALTPTQALA